MLHITVECCHVAIELELGRQRRSSSVTPECLYFDEFYDEITQASPQERPLAFCHVLYLSHKDDSEACQNQKSLKHRQTCTTRKVRLSNDHTKTVALYKTKLGVIDSDP